MLTFLPGIACPNYFLCHPLLRSWCRTPWQNSIVCGLLHTPAQCEWLEAHQNSPEQNPAGSSVVWGAQDSPCSWLHNSPYSALEVGTEKFHPLLSAPGFPRQDPGQLLGATRNVSPEGTRPSSKKDRSSFDRGRQSCHIMSLTLHVSRSFLFASTAMERGEVQVCCLKWFSLEGILIWVSMQVHLLDLWPIEIPRAPELHVQPVHS